MTVQQLIDHLTLLSPPLKDLEVYLEFEDMLVPVLDTSEVEGYDKRYPVNTIVLNGDYRKNTCLTLKKPKLYITQCPRCNKRRETLNGSQACGCEPWLPMTQVIEVIE